MGILTKYGVVKKDQFDVQVYDPIVQGDFEEVVVDGVEFMSIHAFSQYVDPNYFDHVFHNWVDYSAFLKSTQWQIKDTNFDWVNDQVTIILDDSTEYTFPCTTEWGIQDVYAALNSTLS